MCQFFMKYNYLGSVSTANDSTVEEPMSKKRKLAVEPVTKELFLAGK